MKVIRESAAKWRQAIARECRIQYENTAWHIGKLVDDKLYDEAQAYWLGKGLAGAAHANPALRPIGAINIAHRLARAQLEPFFVRQQRTRLTDNQDMITEVVDEAGLEQMIGELLDGLELPPLPATLGEFLSLYQRKPDPPASRSRRGRSLTSGKVMAAPHSCACLALSGRRTVEWRRCTDTGPARREARAHQSAAPTVAARAQRGGDCPLEP